MDELNSYSLSQLNSKELISIEGGMIDVAGFAGRALNRLGSVYAKMESIVRGAYSSGYDAGQNNCKCQE